MDINEIYEVIQGERTYQKQKWGKDKRTGIPASIYSGNQEDLEDYFKSIGEYILYMEHHLHQARMKHLHKIIIMKH